MEGRDRTGENAAHECCVAGVVWQIRSTLHQGAYAMKFVMKQRWFASGNGDFVISDERGRETYRVEGRALVFGKKLTFLDMRDSEVAYISQRMPSWGPTFEVYHGDDLQAIVRRDLFAPPRCRFSVETPAPDDLHADGNLLDHEYTFTREGKPVGRVSKYWFRSSDTYGVDVGPGEDDVLLLASAMVIDLCNHSSKSAGRAAAMGRAMQPSLSGK
jgi:uncharacterized protein YxjI